MQLCPRRKILRKDRARTRSRRSSHRLADPGSMARESIQPSPKGRYLAMEPDLCREIVEAVRVELDHLSREQKNPVVLTHGDIRRHVRDLLAFECPHLPVLSFHELLPAVQVKPIARVDIARGTADSSGLAHEPQG